MTSPERISIELTNRCSKACSFCYNGSAPEGSLIWGEEELVDFVQDCAASGIKAVSFGGGEPLQYPGLFSVLQKLKGRLFRSLTTNGLLLEESLAQLKRAAPEKVHVSIHFPHDHKEVERVALQVRMLADAGIKSGVNLLVARSWLEEARWAAEYLFQQGIGNERIVYLPMRMSDTPAPEELAKVAGSRNFQSMTCLSACGISERFCSIAADKSAAWCSYTTARRVLPELTHNGLRRALAGLPLIFCGAD
ncbi:MAG: radical SAM protein [Candidatus Obscuribacter sp.]|nr:radical SAM protein [Candidatus Melainabacteria bacterium]MDX1987334.1 radical SAM protein [Candidatus Obscuribacter sp.]